MGRTMTGAANTYSSYQQIVTNIDRQTEMVEDQPDVKRATQYYLANIGNVKSVDDFINNTQLFSYAMKAYGLEDMTYAKAFMKKVLTSDLNDSNSFANKLADSRYQDIAKAFDFSTDGDADSTVTQSQTAQQGTVDKYVRQTLEEDAGEDDTGVQLALYFERTAPSVTSYYGILADDALSKVVRTALGFDDSMGLMDIDQQVKILQSKFDITDFQDPKKLEAFIGRFTAMYDLQNPDASSGDQSSTSLLYGSSTEFNISTDLMLAMQSMKP
jgi:hypothetical protein